MLKLVEVARLKNLSGMVASRDSPNFVIRNNVLISGLGSDDSRLRPSTHRGRKPLKKFDVRFDQLKDDNHVSDA